MKVIIKNVAKVPNKYAKLFKWKMYNLAEKFKSLIYIEGFINSEGTSPVEYQLKLRLGIPGHDIIITNKSEKLPYCIHQIDKKAHIQLVNSKEKIIYR